MDNLPKEIEQEICSYLMTCNAHHKYIYKNRKSRLPSNYGIL